ncbi:unnamed protein product [Schistocephalus solidus]|uniref:LSDAT_euk domain-containing protein n=1 Tax=Schistocephalus solidus TaxID=70667 RepID=A0A183TJ08_SCHSO|nr:unnamed protein product [Schistocephalus solidus]
MPLHIAYSEFAKLSNSVLDSAIRDLLQRRWALKPPTLIITVYGTDFEKKRKLKMIFKKGLWKAADSGCWIVTGGFQLGIMKLAGEAVRDYTDAYGGNRMLAFGVASWGCVKKNDILEAALEEVSERVLQLKMQKIILIKTANSTASCCSVVSTAVYSFDLIVKNVAASVGFERTSTRGSL